VTINWYLLYTKAGCEGKVAERLTEAGIEVLIPRVRERRLSRGKPREVLAPLFPCYVFVHFDIYRNFRLVKYTRGVRKLVGTENAPSVVPDVVLEAVRARMDTDGVVTVEPRGFTPGEELTVKEGPFEGLKAVFERELGGTERACVLLRSINARVVIDSSLLDRAGA